MILEAMAFGLAANMQQVTPRRDALIRDLRDGLMQVCLPAQRSGRPVREVVDDHEGTLRLQRLRLSDRAKTEGWVVSEDNRAAVYADKNGCAVTAFVRGEDGEVMDAVTEAMDAISVSGTRIDANRRAEAWTYCVAYDDGAVGSFTLYSRVDRTEPPLGRRVPIKTRVISLFAPTEPECAASE